jgi:DNA-binding protein HU-beta
MKISQSGFVEILAARCSITVTEAERLVHAFKALVCESLASGHSVELSGFRQFSVSHRDARTGVNPRPPYPPITIPELNTPKFKAGEAFEEAVKLKKYRCRCRTRNFAPMPLSPTTEMKAPEKKDWPVIPEDVYQVEITDIAEDVSEYQGRK